MRPILAFAILLLGASSPALEPEYSALAGDYAGPRGDIASSALIEIETSSGRADRLDIAASQPRAVFVDILPPWNRDHQDAADPASADPDADAAAANMEPASTGNPAAPVSVAELCNALAASAHDNDLPIPFFANLIWQESRLRDDVVSRKGALGIAQFMPKVATEKGLDNPFDPLQAIPASARFLRELRLQFGNLGFVAAAYNAGARRVAEWLERRGELPRETRSYVVRVTGLSVDAWRSMAVASDALTFVRRLPCRSLPAFAGVEQAQLQEADAQEAKLQQASLKTSETEDTGSLGNDVPARGNPAHGNPSHGSPAKRGHDRAQALEHPHEARRKRDEPKEHREARRTGHDHHAVKRVAARERRNSA
jgi:hypothetical protein